MAEIYDSLKNLVSGLGTTRDKASYSEFTRTQLSDAYLGTLYRHWVFAKSVDIPADDMVTHWRSCYGSDLRAQDLDDFRNAEMDLGVPRLVNDALKWSRLYGGSVMILDLKDSASMEQEVNWNSLQKECIVSIEVLDSTEVWPEHETTSGSTNRKPFMYRLADGSKVHPSRVIRFDGIRLPWRELQQNRYWGDSILPRIYDDALGAKVTLQSIASMVFESNIDVVKVKDLFGQIMTGQGRQSILERFTLANLTKSINKTLLIDQEREEFQRNPMNFSGLPPLISEFLSTVAAAADIPITRFLGQSAKGFNATGEGDLRNYYDMVSSKQINDLAPQLRQLDKILTVHVFGEQPEGWGFDFNPLWSLSDKDKAEIAKIDAETDAIYVDTLGVIQPHMVAGRLLDQGRYGMLDADFVQDMKATDELEAEEPDEPEIPMVPQMMQPQQLPPVEEPEAEEIEEI